MAGEWETARLGDCVSHQKGFAFKSAEYRSSGHSIARVSNFTDRSIDMAECSYLDPDTVQQYEAYKLRHRDVVIATVGSWPTNPASVVGKTICVPERAEGALLNQNAVRLRTKADLDQRFLFYLLKQPDFQSYIVGTAQGSASQASITLNDIFGFEFQRPPLAEQKAIAAVLGALDDKIECNRRMNATLEAMARALFQSWFVDFDPVRAKLDGRPPAALDPATAALFPEHFDHKAEGVIPTGWNLKKWGDIATLEYGKSIRDYKGSSGKYRVWGTNGPIGFHDEALCNSAGIVIGRKGAYRGVHYSPEPFFVIDTAFYLKPKAALDLKWAYYELLRFDINSMDSGSAIPSTSRDDFYCIPVIVPPPAIQDAFGKIVGGWFAKVFANSTESRTLATLRDTLLPKLLSGELSVAGLDFATVAGNDSTVSKSSNRKEPKP